MPRPDHHVSRRTPRRLLVRVLALVLLCGAPTLSLTAVTTPGAQAIVGGTAAPDGRFRFMASLQNRQGDHFCGGSVVAKRWILTAAHCSERRPGQARVVVGRTVLSAGGGQVLNVTRIVSHPRYAETGTFDVALWKVDRDIRSPRIRIVRRGVERFERGGAPLRVAGWGTRFFGSPSTSDRLRSVGVQAVADAGCVTNGLAGFRPGSEMCAQTLGGDSCQGDSGGPLFARDDQGDPVQVGAVSYGIGCATPAFPGVYAELNNPAIHSFLTRTLRPA